MDNDKKVEISEEILQEIFKIAKINPPQNINDEELLSALLKIKTQGDNIDEQIKQELEKENFNPTSNNILV